MTMTYASQFPPDNNHPPSFPITIENLGTTPKVKPLRRTILGHSMRTRCDLCLSEAFQGASGADLM